MARRSALGRDPLASVGAPALDDLLPPRTGAGGTRRAPHTETSEPETNAPETSAPTPRPAAPRRRRSKQRPEPAHAPGPGAAGRARLTADVPADLLERARAAVYWTPGLTLTALVVDALGREVVRREAQYGERFPPAGELSPGPPAGSR